MREDREMSKTTHWDAETSLGLSETYCSHFWELELGQNVNGGRTGRQKKSRPPPPPPPPALTSHPEASGKGKSMGSRSTGALGLGLEFDPRTVFTDLKMDRFKWAHLYLERKWGSRDQDKATFYSLKIYHHHHCCRHLPPTVPARSREAQAWVT